MMGRVFVRVSDIYTPGAFVIQLEDKPLSRADFSITNIDTLDIRELTALFPVKPIDVLASPLRERYSWQHSFYFEYGELVDPVMRQCPIAGLDPEIQDIMVRIGVSSESDSTTTALIKILERLSARSGAPADITVEVLFSLLSNPRILHDVSSLHQVLLAIGADPIESVNIARDAATLIKNYTFLSKTEGYSTRDMITGHLDLAKERVDKLVTLVDLADPLFNDFFRGMGMLYLLLNQRGEIRHVKLRVNGTKFHQDTLKSILGRSYDSNLAYIDIFPSHML
jgi:hypothetical protein